jgi:hypothetical protein
LNQQGFGRPARHRRTSGHSGRSHYDQQEDQRPSEFNRGILQGFNHFGSHTASGSRKSNGRISLYQSPDAFTRRAGPWSAPRLLARDVGIDQGRALQRCKGIGRVVLLERAAFPADYAAGARRHREAKSLLFQFSRRRQGEGLPTRTPRNPNDLLASSATSPFPVRTIRRRRHDTEATRSVRLTKTQAWSVDRPQWLPRPHFPDPAFLTKPRTRELDAPPAAGRNFLSENGARTITRSRRHTRPFTFPALRPLRPLRETLRLSCL